MANIFSALFGSKYPSTAKFEAISNELKADYSRYLEYEGSTRYKRYLELDQLIHSGDFVKKVEKLKKERFKDTSEFLKYRDFLIMKKAGDLKKYFKYEHSGLPGKLEKIKESSDFSEFESLKKYISGSEFAEVRQQKGFKKSEAFTQFKRYKALVKNSDLKLYFKQIKGSSYANYKNLHGSERLNEFMKLETYIQSEEFRNFKAEIEDPKRYKKSEEHALITEYDEIKKTPEFIWFDKTKSKNPFVELIKWNLTFEDDFDDKALNKNHWITGYYWGKALLNDTYVLADEYQFFQEKNVELRDSIVRLTTKNEKASGKVWDSERGFMPQDFEFTSALISTGQSFRQLYGKFEAKVKIDHDENLTHAFWMVSELVSPQIDVFRFSESSPKKFNVGYHLMDKNNKATHLTKQVNGGAFGNDYFIYSLEWSKDKIEWFINGVKVHELSSNVPHEPMYLVFSTHILKEVANINLPKSINIDWVRCYQKAE